MNASIREEQAFVNAVGQYEMGQLLQQAILNQQAGRLTEAAATYHHILQADPNQTVALNNLSLMVNDQQAVALLRQALAIAPQYVDALINMSVRLSNLKQTDVACRYALQAKQYAPEDERVKVLLQSFANSEIKAETNTRLAANPIATGYTVIVPTHKRPYLLARALASIQQQRSDQGYEVIVVADCVDAQTDEVCRQWLRNTDTYVRRSGVAGPSASRNLGLSLAKGKIIMFLDDDDAWHPGLVEKLDQCDALQKGEPVFFDCSVVKESRTKNNPIKLSESEIQTMGRLDENVFVKNQLHMSCLATPRHWIADLDFDVHMRAYEDWDFMLALFARKMPKHVPILGSQIHEVDDDSTDRRGSSQAATDFNAVLDYLYVYRRHAVNPSLQNKRAQLLAGAGLSVPSECL